MKSSIFLFITLLCKLLWKTLFNILATTKSTSKKIMRKGQFQSNQLYLIILNIPCFLSSISFLKIKLHLLYTSKYPLFNHNSCVDKNRNQNCLNARPQVRRSVSSVKKIKVSVACRYS